MASKLLSIYQIGDVTINFFPSEWHGLTMQAQSAVQSLLFSNEVLFGAGPRQVEPQAITLTGIAVGLSTMSVQAQLNILSGLIGVETDIIGVEFIDCCSDINCCGRCGNKNGGDILPFVTRGFLTRVQASQNDQAHNITLTIQVSPYWTVMNRAIWKWGGHKLSVWVPQSPPAMPQLSIKPYPFATAFFNKECATNMFVKRVWDDEFYMLDPDVWAWVHKLHRPGFPLTGIGKTWDTDNIDAIVWSDIKHFSAPPSSIYAVRNVSLTSVLTINVRRFVGGDVWAARDLAATINFGDIDAQLASLGYTGILAGDIFYFGDTARKPIQVLRGGVILPAVLTATYEGEYIGATGYNQSRVQITKALYSDPLEMAYLHTFRRL